MPHTTHITANRTQPFRLTAPRIPPTSAASDRRPGMPASSPPRYIPGSDPRHRDLGRVLDGEPVPDRRLLAAVEREIPGELAQVGLLGRGRARLPEPDPDLAVGGHRDAVVHADRGRAGAVVLHGYLVADVDRAGAADNGL